MRLGVCAAIEKAEMLAQAGADYIELPVTTALIPTAGENEWLPQRDRLRALPLPCETFNLFLPGAFRLVGAERTDLAVVRAYVLTALRRAVEVGGKIIVFGSGGARRVLDGVDRGLASEQLRAFLMVCTGASDETGVIVAVEPLNRSECNVINSVAEAVAEYVAPIARSGIRVLADTYHMEREGEDLSVLTVAAPFLAHVHTADTGRVAPGRNGYDHAALFAALRTIGYAGRVSVEANFADFDAEVAPALAHLRASLGRFDGR